MRMGAWLSTGMRLGHRDRLRFRLDARLCLSRTKPRGIGPLGRMIDRTFLDAIGWRGIRQRKLHLEELIARRAAALKAAGQPRAHRRYRRRPRPLRARRSRDECAERPDSHAAAGLLRAQCRAGRKLIADEAASTTIARFARPTPSTPTALRHRPGAGPRHRLRPLRALSRQRADRRSLGGLAAPMPPGSCSLHQPALASAARNDRARLTSHRGGQAWVMRRRTQGEMDQLVAAAGFEKLDAAHRPVGHLHRLARAARLRARGRCTRRRPDLPLPRRDEPYPASCRAALGWPFWRRFLFDLRLRQLAGVAARPMSAASSLAGNTTSRSWPGRSCPTGRSTSSTACRCSSRQQARRRPPSPARYLTAQIVAVACFIAVPSERRPSYGRRPRPAGFPVRGARRLRQAVQPGAVAAHRAAGHHLGSLAPALWGRRLGVKLVWHVWCFLIGASVLTTWQHHFIDIPTGALLGLFALWLFPPRATCPSPVSG